MYFRLSYLATLLRSCMSLPVTIQSEHHCAFIIHAKQLAVNFFYTHAWVCSVKQLLHRRMPSSVCTASLSSSLHSGQIRAALWGSVVSYPGMISCSFSNSKRSKTLQLRKNRNQHISLTFISKFFPRINPLLIPRSADPTPVTWPLPY